MGEEGFRIDQEIGAIFLHDLLKLDCDSDVHLACHIASDEVRITHNK